LDPVLIVHGQISVNKSFKKINLTSFLNVENVLNKDFVWVRGFPMPGRFTQLGIKINFKTKEK
jgi:outer membrane receptor protein involved in Fe transport